MNQSQAVWSRDLCSAGDIWLEDAASLICQINLGATAIGTGITAHPDYAELVREKLGEIAGIPVVIAIDLIEATQDLRLLCTALWGLEARRGEGVQDVQ